jgi:hypothetical protein
MPMRRRGTGAGVVPGPPAGGAGVKTSLVIVVILSARDYLSPQAWVIFLYAAVKPCSE